MDIFLRLLEGFTVMAIVSSVVKEECDVCRQPQF